MKKTNMMGSGRERGEEVVRDRSKRKFESQRESLPQQIERYEIVEESEGSGVVAWRWRASTAALGGRGGRRELGGNEGTRESDSVRVVEQKKGRR